MAGAGLDQLHVAHAAAATQVFCKTDIGETGRTGCPPGAARTGRSAADRTSATTTAQKATMQSASADHGVGTTGWLLATPRLV
jgi:hypothetical protein